MKRVTKQLKLSETGEMPEEPNTSSSHALSYDEVKSQMEEQKSE